MTIVYCNRLLKINRPVVKISIAILASFSLLYLFKSNQHRLGITSDVQWIDVDNPSNYQAITANNISIKWSSSLQKVDNHRILFHETSGRQSLNLRQNCAVESAAKENPSRLVQLFLAIEKLNYSDTWLSVLRQYDNIQVILINETEYFAQSPLESWYREGVWRTSPFYKEHLADYIRMLFAIQRRWTLHGLGFYHAETL